MCSVTNTVILYRLDSLPQLWQSLPLWTAAPRVVLEFADLFFFRNFSDICKVGWNVKQATHTHTGHSWAGERTVSSKCCLMSDCRVFYIITSYLLLSGWSLETIFTEIWNWNIWNYFFIGLHGQFLLGGARQQHEWIWVVINIEILTRKLQS